MKSALTVVLFRLFTIGVFVDGKEASNVLVMERDSVTLKSGDTDVHKNDLIEWRFNGIRIDKFGDRLQLDSKTGDLKISNIRTKDSGLYKVKISSTRGSSVMEFNVTAATDPRSDGVTIVSVAEGDSVVLHTGVPEIQKDDEILWRFRDKDVIAKIKKDEHTFLTYDNGAGCIFRNRLQLNSLTGNIIISDIRNSTSGLYEVDFKKISYTTHKSFNVTIRDMLNIVQVKEGVSVILQSGVPKLERDDVLQWRFNHEDHFMAKINKTAQPTFGTDERFRDRLELDNETGSLTIKSITSKHAGLYHLEITSNRHIIFKKFNVSVYGSGLSPGVVAGIALLAAAVGAAVGAAAAGFVVYRRCKISKLERQREENGGNVNTQKTDDPATEETKMTNDP